MSDGNHQQNERGEWEPAEPLPYLGHGIDWEVDDRSPPIVAKGYIGAELVTEVKARSKKMLALKMFAAGHKYRNTAQDSGTA